MLRLLWPAIWAGVGLLAGSALAQGPGGPPPGGAAPDPGAGQAVTNPLVAQARQVEREGRILEILQALNVKPEQAPVLADAIRTIVSAQTDLNGRIANVFGRLGQAVDAYILAVLEDAPQAFDVQSEQQVGALVVQIDQLRTAYKQICDQQYQRVYDILTPGQVAGIETYQERAARNAEAGGGGGASLATVVAQILDVRALDPAVYAERAERLAGDIARSIAGDNAQLAQPLTTRALALMEEARAMAQEPTPEQQQEFRLRVSQELGLPNLGEGPPPGAPDEGIAPDCVAQAAIENLLRDPASYDLIVRFYHLTPPTPAGGQ